MKNYTLSLLAIFATSTVFAAQSVEISCNLSRITESNHRTSKIKLTGRQVIMGPTEKWLSLLARKIHYSSLVISICKAIRKKELTHVEAGKKAGVE